MLLIPLELLTSRRSSLYVSCLIRPHLTFSEFLIISNPLVPYDIVVSAFSRRALQSSVLDSDTYPEKRNLFRLTDILRFSRGPASGSNSAADLET